jgi:hypothetical protein
MHTEPRQSGSVTSNQTSEQPKDPVELLREAFEQVSKSLTADIEPATIYIPDDNS